jgi:hypothetical protein
MLDTDLIRRTATALSHGMPLEPNGLNQLIQAIAEYTAANSFTSRKSDTAELQDAGLGIAISHWADWSGERILRVASAALQDANLKSEDAQVRQMLEDLHRE